MDGTLLNWMARAAFFFLVCFTEDFVSWAASCSGDIIILSPTSTLAADDSSSSDDSSDSSSLLVMVLLSSSDVSVSTSKDELKLKFLDELLPGLTSCCSADRMAGE